MSSVSTKNCWKKNTKKINAPKKIDRTQKNKTTRSIYNEMNDSTNFSIEQSSAYETPKVKRRTRPVLTRFERAKVLALRAEQIDRGTQPLVEKLEGDGPLATAEREFAAGRIPFVIRRYLPDGKHEDWRLEELEPCDRRLSHK